MADALMLRTAGRASPKMHRRHVSRGALRARSHPERPTWLPRRHHPGRHRMCGLPKARLRGDRAGPHHCRRAKNRFFRMLHHRATAAEVNAACGRSRSGVHARHQQDPGMGRLHRPRCTGRQGAGGVKLVRSVPSTTTRESSSPTPRPMASPRPAEHLWRKHWRRACVGKAGI